MRARLVCTFIVPVALMLPALPARAQEASANDGKFTLAPAGYVQFDFRAFPNWDVVPGTGRLNRSTAEVRRAGVGIEGSWRRLSFELSVDPRDDDGVFVKDAYAQVRISRAMRLRVGQFKIPGTREYDTSARRLDFLERSPLTESLAVRRDVGARVDGRRGALGYEAGVFAGDGVGRAERAGVTVAGRATWQLTGDLEIGGSASDGTIESVDTDDPTGLEGRSLSGYRFFDGLYVKGHRLRLGADAVWSPGRWRVMAEMLRARDERDEQGLDFEDLPVLVGTGISLSARRQVVNRLEGALRYDYLGFDDAGGNTATDSVRPRATNVRARASHALTLGSTLVLNRWMRVLGNVGLERYSEPRSAPEPGTSNYLTLGTRLQLEWP